MGGGKAKGSKFSSSDQLRMQQEMINNAIRAQDQAQDRTKIQDASVMPPVTPLNLGPLSVPKLPAIPKVSGIAGAPGVENLPNAPGVKSVDWTPLPLHDLPELDPSLRDIDDAPGVSKTAKIPKVKAMPRLFDPSSMPVRDAASLLAAKKGAVKAAAGRQGRAATILTR